MEEDEFRKTYRNLVEFPCPFEKAILSNHCQCQNVQRMHIAERHAAGCNSEKAQAHCILLMATLRDKAKFSLRLSSITGLLPHGKELKVQVGGLQGIAQAVDDSQYDLTNIFALVIAGLQKFGSLDNLPYQIIIQAIAKFEGRPKRGKKT